MKFISILLVSFISIAATAQVSSKDSSASCLAHWKKGESKILYIKRSKETVKQDAPSSKTDFGYEAHISVTDSSKDGYTLQWVFHLPALLKIIHPGFSDSMPVYEGLKMIYTTTPDGSFKELLNWQEVRDAYVKMMMMSFPKNLNDTALAVIEKTKAIFNTKEIVETTLIPEIQLYHAPYGDIFSLAGTKRQTFLSNPLGGEPIPASITLKATELKQGQDSFKATMLKEMDRDAALKFLSDFLKKMNVDADTSVIRAKELMTSFEVKDYNEYKVSLLTGWITTVNHKKTVEIPTVKQSDSFIMEMKK